MNESDPDCQPDGQPDSTADTQWNVRVIRSAQRRKTCSARLVDATTIEVRVPARLSREQTQRSVAELVDRVVRQARGDSRRTDDDLMRRAARLSGQLGLDMPLVVSWSSRQLRRFGSCTPDRRVIRLSDRLKVVPDYVLDAVLVHEMAHLSHPNHDAAFWALAKLAPRLERADGFLEAMALGCHDPRDDPPDATLVRPGADEN